MKTHDGTAWGWYLFRQEKRLIAQKVIKLPSRLVSSSFEVAVVISRIELFINYLINDLNLIALALGGSIGTKNKAIDIFEWKLKNRNYKIKEKFTLLHKWILILALITYKIGCLKLACIIKINEAIESFNNCL